MGIGLIAGGHYDSPFVTLCSLVLMQLLHSNSFVK